jgi:signal transduction histidine kinase
VSVSAPPRLSAIFTHPRLLQAAVCGVAALLIVVAWSVVSNRLRTERATAVAAAITQNRVRTVALEQYVRRTLEAADLAMRHAAERLEQDVEREGPAPGIALIEDFTGNDHLWGGISIADAQGNLVASTVRGLKQHANVARQPAFAVHRNGTSGRLYVSPPRYSPGLGGDFLWLTRRIDHKDGRFAGVVAINLPPHRLTQLYTDVEMRPSDLISVIGLDGITRARRTGGRLSSGEDLRGRLVMRMQQRAPNGSYRGPNSLSGGVHYFSHRRLPEYDLFVTSGMTEASILAPVGKRIAAVALNAGIFTLLVLAAAGFFLVVVGRRHAQMIELGEANRRLNQAQRIGQMGDWSYDRRTDRSNWSDHLLEMYGRAPAEGAPGYRAFMGLLDADGRTAFKSAVRRAIETHLPQRCDFVLRRDLSETHREVMVVPVVEKGAVVGFYGTDRDITTERELEQMRSRLAHASRVGAMNAMASTLAHELNQPLAAAKNYLIGSRRLAQGGDPSLTDGIRSAEQQISFAGDIIRRIRSMVQGQASAAEHVELADAWNAAVMLVSAAGRQKGFKTAVALDADASAVFVDRIQLKQVFVNLLRNALAATEGQRNRRISVSSRRLDEDLVQVTVSDTGRGFPEDMADPFSAFSSATRDGLGLGLSISRTIVEAHHGRIWAERTDRLTSIHFTLPMPLADRQLIAAE